MATLLDVLLADEEAWVALLKITTVEDAQLVAGALARIFCAEGNDLALVKYCILIETLNTVQESLLLRGSGVHFAIVSQSGLIHGRPFIQRAIGPVLNDLIHKTQSSFEIDPKRLSGADDLEVNTANLLKLANHALAALLMSADNMPVPLRRTYEYAQRIATEKFPSHAPRIPKALFFLRVLCPMLVAPDEHGLCKGKPSERALRAHVLLAKLLQSVANEVAPFDKEPYMQPLNSWVESAIPSVKRFFKIVLGVVAGDPLQVSSRLRMLHAVPNPTAKEDAKILRKFIKRHNEEYRLVLVEGKSYETLLKVNQFLPTNEDRTDSSSSSSNSLANYSTSIARSPPAAVSSLPLPSNVPEKERDKASQPIRTGIPISLSGNLRDGSTRSDAPTRQLSISLSHVRSSDSASSATSPRRAELGGRTASPLDKREEP